MTTADSASYSVSISNAYGNVSSSPAALTVFFVPPPDSIQPYAWWLFNEGAGATAFDYSGNGHNGTLNSDASWTAGGFSGNGVYFNATEFSFIAISNAFLVSGNWTVTMWVNRWESKDASTLISGTTYALKLEQHADSSELGYTHYGVGDYALTNVTPLNTWVHLAFVKTATGISLYTNGVYATTNNHAASLNATMLGCDLYTVYTDYLDATLDDVRIYTNTLTAAQISSIHTYGRVTPIPSVAIAAPTNSSSFVVFTNIALAANVVSNGLSILNVGFYRKQHPLGPGLQATVCLDVDERAGGKLSGYRASRLRRRGGRIPGRGHQRRTIHGRHSHQLFGRERDVAAIVAGRSHWLEFAGANQCARRRAGHELDGHHQCERDKSYEHPGHTHQWQRLLPFELPLIRSIKSRVCLGRTAGLCAGFVQFHGVYLVFTAQVAAEDEPLHVR